MKVVLLGYNGLIGGHILRELAGQFKKNNKFNLICVGRNIRNQPFKNKKIKYIKWNFLDFSKSKLFFLEKESIIINCVGKNSSKEKDLHNLNVIFIKQLLHYIKINKIIVRLIHLGSVSVYGAEKKYCNKIFNITESSTLSSYDLYSKSKIESDLLIQDYSKKNYNDFSFTILRIANVFSYSNNPKSFRLINYLLMKGIWFNCSNNTNYHFIHAKDIAFAVLLCILNLQKSKNKIYIVSDDINQLQLHKIYAKKNKSLLFKIPVPLKLLELIIKNISLPSIILNFLLTISSQVIYDNNKIKKELNYKILYSLKKF